MKSSGIKKLQPDTCSLITTGDSFIASEEKVAAIREHFPEVLSSWRWSKVLLPKLLMQLDVPLWLFALWAIRQQITQPIFLLMNLSWGLSERSAQTLITFLKISKKDREMERVSWIVFLMEAYFHILVIVLLATFIRAFTLGICAPWACAYCITGRLSILWLMVAVSTLMARPCSYLEIDQVVFFNIITFGIHVKLVKYQGHSWGYHSSFIDWSEKACPWFESFQPNLSEIGDFHAVIQRSSNVKQRIWFYQRNGHCHVIEEIVALSRMPSQVWIFVIILNY